jgi:hypothetical protein
MRAGVLVSGIGHVGFVMLTLLAWPTQPLREVAAGEVVPVDVVSISDISNVRALTTVTPEEQETAPAEQAAAQQAETGTEAPAPPRERQQRPADSFDLAALARDLMGDQRNTPRPRTVPNAQQADRARQGAGLGTADQARLEDYIRARGNAHIGRCWRAPVDSANPERLAVVVEIDLDRTGHIRGAPRVVSPSTLGASGELRAAIDNAVRAVRACDPYPFADDERTADHYELWRQIEFNLDPTNVGR